MAVDEELGAREKCLGLGDFFGGDGWEVRARCERTAAAEEDVYS
jgi:hypothetical protein